MLIVRVITELSCYGSLVSGVMIMVTDDVNSTPNESIHGTDFDYRTNTDYDYYTNRALAIRWKFEYS